MSIYSDIQGKLAAFDQMMDAKLEEIRQIRNEIVQLQTKLQGEYKWGTYLHDDKRIVISAPEIIIGNVDKMGHLQGGTVAKVIIRGNKVNVEGVGNGDNNTGIITNQATRIINRASDPGPYGVEDIVYQKSLIANIARAINLRGVEDLGTFYTDFENAPAGIHIHSDNSMTLEANQPLAKTAAQLDKKMAACQALDKQYDTTLKQLKASLDALTKKMSDTIAQIEEMNADRDNIRNNAVEYSTLNTVLHKYTGEYYALTANYFGFQTTKAENARQMKVLTAMKEELNKQVQRAGNKTTTLNGNIIINSTAIDVNVADDGGTYRSDAKSGFQLNASDIRINAREDSGKLLPDGCVTIGGQNVKIDTNEFDGDFTSGSVKIPGKGMFSLLSKNIKLESVDYSLDNGAKKEEALTAGGNMQIRTESVSVMSTSTDGKATGSISLNAKDVTVASSDYQKDDKGAYSPQGLAAGGNINVTGETIALGHANSKEVKMAADVATVQGKSEAKLAQGGIGSAPEAAVVVQGGSTNIASSSNTDIYGNIGLRGETKVSAGISGPKASFDGLEVSKGLKTPNFSDGLPGSAPGAESKPDVSSVNMPEGTGSNVSSPEPRKVEEKKNEQEEVSTVIATVEALPEVKDDEDKNADDNVNINEEKKDTDPIEDALAEDEQQDDEQQEDENKNQEDKKQDEEQKQDDKKEEGQEEDKKKEEEEQQKEEGDLINGYDYLIRVLKQESENSKIEYGSPDTSSNLKDLATRYEQMADNAITLAKANPKGINAALSFISKDLLIPAFTSKMSNSTLKKIQDIKAELQEMQNQYQLQLEQARKDDETKDTKERISNLEIIGYSANQAGASDAFDTIRQIALANQSDKSIADLAISALFKVAITNPAANADKAMVYIKEITLKAQTDPAVSMSRIQNIAFQHENSIGTAIGFITELALISDKNKDDAAKLILTLGRYDEQFKGNAMELAQQLGYKEEEQPVEEDNRKPVMKIADELNLAADCQTQEEMDTHYQNIHDIAMANLQDADGIAAAYCALHDIAIYADYGNAHKSIDLIHEIARQTDTSVEYAFTAIRSIGEKKPDTLAKVVEYIEDIALGADDSPYRMIQTAFKTACATLETPDEQMSQIAQIASENKSDEEIIKLAVSDLTHLALFNAKVDPAKVIGMLAQIIKDSPDYAEQGEQAIMSIVRSKNEQAMLAATTFHDIAKEKSDLKDNIITRLITLGALYTDHYDEIISFVNDLEDKKKDKKKESQKQGDDAKLDDETQALNDISEITSQCVNDSTENLKKNISDITDIACNRVSDKPKVCEQAVDSIVIITLSNQKTDFFDAINQIATITQKTKVSKVASIFGILKLAGIRERNNEMFSDMGVTQLSTLAIETIFTIGSNDDTANSSTSAIYTIRVIAEHDNSVADLAKEKIEALEKQIQ